MGKTREILLVIIILGLGLNLLADMLWHYLPDSKVYPHTYLVATLVLVLVCVLHLVFAPDGLTRGSITKICPAYLPRKSLKFVPNMPYGHDGEWSYGKVRGEPAMYLHGKWYVTNMTEKSVEILRAYLVKPRTEATMVPTKHPANGVFGDYPILAGSTTEVCADFWIHPPIRKEGEYLQGKIVFIDQFNNKHKVKARFTARKGNTERILSTKWRSKWQDQLNNNLLPKGIRKKLDRKDVLLSHDAEVSISLRSSQWVIDDNQKPRAVFTAKVMGNKIYLHKPLMSRREYREKAKVVSNRLEEGLVVCIERDSKCPDELNNIRLPQELRDVLEPMGELLSRISTMSLKGSTRVIGNTKNQRTEYSAELMGKRVILYKQLISDKEQIGDARIESNRVEQQPIIRLRLNPKCPDVIPKELSAEISRMGESLSRIATVSIHMTSAEWEIRDSQKEHTVYVAMLNKKKLCLCKRFIPPPTHRPVTPVWKKP